MASSSKLNGTLRKFIEAQPMFFVATAAADGRVNLSPKGLNSLKIIDDNTIIWLNLSGSGNETASHIRQMPRMTLMFCAFEGDAKILRTYGTAEVIHPGDDSWKTHEKHFEPMAGSRQIFIFKIDLVQISCGSGVPFMAFQDQRGPVEMLPFFDEMGPDGVRDFWNRKNAVDIDGKPTGI